MSSRELITDRLPDQWLHNPLHTTEVTRVNMLLSTRLRNLVPRLNTPAVMPPAPLMTSATPPPQQTRVKTYSEEDEEMAEALRQDLAASFVSSPIPFDLLPQAPQGPTATASASAISPPLTDLDMTAALHGGNFPCEHCGKPFSSPFAVNGHKAHSKECSKKGRNPGSEA